MSRRLTRHVLALLFMGLVTISWMLQILGFAASRLPGEGAGDNLLFVWNLWWTRHAIQSAVWPLWCPVIFVPFGVNLTLHTHTLLPTAIVALVMRSGSV